MYYIRKLGKPFNFNKIKDAKSIEEVDSDIIKQELSTMENTLSFWKCGDLDDMSDTLKAIILSTSEINKSKFIIIDSKFIQEYGLETRENKGKTGYKGFADLHIDICNLTYKKIGKLLEIYKKNFDHEYSTYELQRDEVKKMIEESIDNKQIDADNLNDRLKRDIIKLADSRGLSI